MHDEINISANPDQRETRATRSVHSFALACAMGMVIGLIPNHSVLVLVFAVVLIFTSANLVIAAMSAVAFTWTGMLMDGFTHKLGALVLTSNHLEPFWTWLNDLPLVPWTRINNTVVMGSLILGLLVFYPTYRLGGMFYLAYGPRIRRILNRNRIYCWIMGHERPRMGGART